MQQNASSSLVDWLLDGALLPGSFEKEVGGMSERRSRPRVGVKSETVCCKRGLRQDLYAFAEVADACYDVINKYSTVQLTLSVTLSAGIGHQDNMSAIEYGDPSIELKNAKCRRYLGRIGTA